MLASTLMVMIVVVFCAMVHGQPYSDECVRQCNNLRLDVLTLEICREAKRTLPRPKVGEFCTTAMEQGFSDACVPLCMGQQPVVRVSQTCRAAAIEMPRPTVRRWCEHGYTEAYSRTLDKLGDHFGAAKEQPNEEQPFLEEIPTSSQQAQGDAAPKDVYKEADSRPVVATIPVTLDDNDTKNLLVHEGQSAEEAVVEFCRENVADDVGACIRQLLSVVIDKLNESAN